MNKAKLKANALKYAKAKSAEITEKRIKRYTSKSISIFMAGSSGAGKTETAKRILNNIPPGNILRIDPDELREEFPDYNGENASIFQEAVTFLAKEIYKAALERGINLLFDGTFSDTARLDEYIDLSLEKNRVIAIVYVYQDPVKAWEFVRARAKKEGRTVPKDRHVKSYFGARESVNIAKQQYGGKVFLHLVIKDDNGQTKETFGDVESIDKHIPEVYNEETLTAKLVGAGDKNASN